MNGNCLDKLKGKYCKIVTQEPGEFGVTVFYGEITDVDYEGGFIIVQSDKGIGVINIQVIEAIKPAKKR